MKLRLFALRDTRTNKLVPDLFFHDKPAARKERDARNVPSTPSTTNRAHVAETPHPLTYVITPGPDHRNFSRS